MDEVQGVIQSIEPRQVKTQWGPKETTNFTIDGVTYSGGFKKWHNINIGDEVFVTFETTPQGYRNIKGMSVVAAGSGGPLPQTNTAPKSGSGKGGRSFPVEPLAPERTINRQNALTAAANIHASIIRATGDLDLCTKEGVVDMARYFEAYTTGDLDLAEAKALAGGDD
jgi:hypothetical protein